MSATLSAELMDTLAERAARAWVDALVLELRTQRRPMCGGWPGTLSEARERTAAHLRAELGASYELDTATLEVLARKTYGVARAGWLAQAARDQEA